MDSEELVTISIRKSHFRWAASVVIGLLGSAGGNIVSLISHGDVDEVASEMRNIRKQVQDDVIIRELDRACYAVGFSKVTGPPDLEMLDGLTGESPK